MVITSPCLLFKADWTNLLADQSVNLLARKLPIRLFRSLNYHGDLKNHEMKVGDWTAVLCRAMTGAAILVQEATRGDGEIGVERSSEPCSYRGQSPFSTFQLYFQSGCTLCLVLRCLRDFPLTLYHRSLFTYTRGGVEVGISVPYTQIIFHLDIEQKRHSLLLTGTKLLQGEGKWHPWGLRYQHLPEALTSDRTCGPGQTLNPQVNNGSGTSLRSLRDPSLWWAEEAEP